MENVARRVKWVRERMDVAAVRSSRNPSSVRLIAVTKYVSAESKFLPALMQADCFHFGEARVQSLVQKTAFFQNGDKIHWHFLGPLQRNKVRRMLPLCKWIHSVDSLALLEAIDRIAQEEQFASTPKLLLEVNISAEESKQGFSPSQLPGVWDFLEKRKNLHVFGLMGMSGLHSPPDQKRQEFASLRLLAETFRNQTPDNVILQELSIGMSDDFEIAIEEGATMVRIGSLLYEP